MSDRSKRDLFITDFFVSFLVVFGVVMFLPMFLKLQSIFGVSISKIAWLPNIGYLTLILFSPFVGKIIRKTGAKKLLLGAMSLWIVGILVEILAIKMLDFNVFLIGRFIEGVGEAAFFPILLSMNKELLKKKRDEKLGSSLVETGAAIGGLTAAILAGYFTGSLQAFLLIPICIGLITAAFVSIRIKDIEQEKNIEEVQHVTIKENKKAYIMLLLAIFMIQVVFASSQVFLAYYMEAFSASNITGMVISFQQVAVAVGTISPVILLEKFSHKDIGKAIVLVFLVCAILLGLQLNLGISLISLVLICLFVGIGFTTLNVVLSKTITSNVSQKISFYTSVRFSGGFALSYSFGKAIEVYKASGYNYAETFRVLYLFIALFVVITMLIILLLQKEKTFRKIQEESYGL